MGSAAERRGRAALSARPNDAHFIKDARQFLPLALAFCEPD